MLQPIDAGVIYALKRRYKRRQMMRVVDLVDTNKSSIYNVDVLTAMDWIKEEWDAIEPRKILNCWLHTKLVHREIEGEASESFVEEHDEQTLSQLMARVCPDAEDRMSIKNFLNPEGEDECVEVPTDDSMVAEIVESLSGMTVCEPEPEKDTETPCFSVKKLKECLATTKIHYETTFPENESFIRDLRNVLNAIRNEEVRSMPQSRISEFFK